MNLKATLKRLFRSKPREKSTQEINDDYAMQVALRAWNTGKAQVGTVDEDGKLTIREIDSDDPR